jgi:hypothetical protein
MSKHPEDQTARMLEMFDNLQSDKYQPKEYKYIGQNVPRRIDGLAKASGQADYTMDIQVPGMLYMRLLMSPYPNAKILKMDVSRAEKLPGVRYVLRYDDPEVLKATARETATRRIKESLLLEAVARQENLTVTDEETEAEIQTLARLYRQEPSAMRTSLEDPVRRAGLMGRILERKALDFLMAQATISEAYHLIKPA